MTSIAELEAKAAQERNSLRSSLSDLQTRVSPATLSGDLSASLSEKMSRASSALTDKVATPAGLVAVCAMAFTSAFTASGSLRRTQPFTPSGALAPPRRIAPRNSGETLRMLAQLSAAVAAGAVASRFLPKTETERTLLASVGPELRQAVQNQIKDQADRLVNPPSGRYGTTNLLAMGAAMLLNRKR